MIKKILFTLLSLFVAIIFVFFIWRYVGYARDKDPYKTFLMPRVELSQIEITSITNEKVEMTAKIVIENHIPLSFTADSLQYVISIDSVDVIKDHYKKSVTLKSDGDSWISLPVTILKHDLTTVLENNKQKNVDSVEYRLKASFYTNILFKKKFSVNIGRLLPLIYIPEVKADHIKVNSINFSRAAIHLIISINNQNAFPYKAKNLAYAFSIENNKWIKGTIPGITDIKAKSVTELRIPMRISFKEVGETLFDLLKKGNKVKYELHLTFRSESENNMLKNSKVIIVSSGTVNSLMKAAKNKN